MSCRRLLNSHASVSLSVSYSVMSVASSENLCSTCRRCSLLFIIRDSVSIWVVILMLQLRKGCATTSVSSFLLLTSALHQPPAFVLFQLMAALLFYTPEWVLVHLHELMGKRQGSASNLPPPLTRLHLPTTSSRTNATITNAANDVSLSKHDANEH